MVDSIATPPTDPPDTLENECPWCGHGANPAAFCKPECELASYAANEERKERNAAADSEQCHRVSNHDACLAYIARMGL